MNRHTLPMPVKATPFAHQQQTFDFVCDLFGLTSFEDKSSGASLLMEMGTGKSFVGIGVAGILYYAAARIKVAPPMPPTAIPATNSNTFQDNLWE